jgi:hypothetical protein
MKKQMYYGLNGHLMTDIELEAYMHYHNSILDWEYHVEHGASVEPPKNKK